MVYNPAAVEARTSKATQHFLISSCREDLPKAGAPGVVFSKAGKTDEYGNYRIRVLPGTGYTITIVPPPPRPLPAILPAQCPTVR